MNSARRTALVVIFARSAHLALMLNGDEAAPSTLSPRTLLLIENVRLEWRKLDRCIAALTTEFVARARDDEAARRLTTVPGIGALNATACPATFGTDPFASGGSDPHADRPRQAGVALFAEPVAIAPNSDDVAVVEKAIEVGRGCEG